VKQNFQVYDSEMKTTKHQNNCSFSFWLQTPDVFECIQTDTQSWWWKHLWKNFQRRLKSRSTDTGNSK